MDINEMALELQQVKESLANLQKETRLVKDKQEIENIIARYEYYHEAEKDSISFETIWAQHTPGTRSASNVGVMEGIEHFKNMGDEGEPLPGKLNIHMQTTPVIEVAGDGKTAKGVWICFGIESGAFPQDLEAQIPEIKYDPHIYNGVNIMAQWLMFKMAVDFIKEDGVWKIWHYHTYNIMRAPFYEDWVTFSMKRPLYEKLAMRSMQLKNRQMGPGPNSAAGGPEGDEPAAARPMGKPPSYNWEYSIDAVVELVPEPPMPYETFTETFK